MSLFGERFMLRTDLRQERAVEVLSSIAEPIRIDDRLYVVKVYGNRFYIQEEVRGPFSRFTSWATDSPKRDLRGSVRPISVNGEVKTDVGGTVVEGWISVSLTPQVRVISAVLVPVMWAGWFLVMFLVGLDEGFDPDPLMFLVIGLVPCIVMLPLAALIYRGLDRKFQAQVQMMKQVLQALL